jgi:hypothetical protein
MSLKDRIRFIEYEYLKDITINLTDEKKIEIAMNLLSSCLKSETTIVDSELPTSLLGCTLDWSQGTTNDYIVKISSGSNSYQQNVNTDNRSILSIYTPESEFVVSGSSITAFNGTGGETSISISPSLGITSIAPYVFAGHGYGVSTGIDSITSIEFPSTLTSINSNTFNGWLSIDTITLNSITPLSNIDWIGECSSSLRNIYVPKSVVDVYKTAWPIYADKIKANPNN